MLDEKDLFAIGTLIDAKLDEKLKPIKDDIADLKEDVSAIKDDIAELKESTEETRSGVNALLDWAEDCGRMERFPLPRLGEKKAQ